MLRIFLSIQSYPPPPQNTCSYATSAPHPHPHLPPAGTADSPPPSLLVQPPCVGAGDPGLGPANRAVLQPAAHGGGTQSPSPSAHGRGHRAGIVPTASGRS